MGESNDAAVVVVVVRAVWCVGKADKTASMRHDDGLRCPRLGCSLCKEDASADPRDPRDPRWLDPSLAASLERGDLCKRQSPMQRIEIMATGPSVVGG